MSISYLSTFSLLANNPDAGPYSEPPRSYPHLPGTNLKLTPARNTGIATPGWDGAK